MNVSALPLFRRVSVGYAFVAPGPTRQRARFGATNACRPSVAQPVARRLGVPCTRAVRDQASSEGSGEDSNSWEQQLPASAASVQDQGVFELACPICQSTSFKVNMLPVRSGSLCCPRCRRTFDSSEDFLDLTIDSGTKPKVYKRKEWMGTELFRNPLVSAVYERGWRQTGGGLAGFPGVDKEFDMAMDYFAPAQGQVLVDMSCGSGLFSRRFAKSGKFKGVIAADFSEAMLRQTREYCKEDGTLSGSTPVLLLRADVGRLPFPTGSLSALHAGLAIHCWSNPQAALAEISRVLKPGGVFVASTVLVPTAPLGQALGNDDIVRPLSKMIQMLVQGQFKPWEEEELRDLCTSVGLVGFERKRNLCFILFTVRKPVAA